MAAEDRLRVLQEAFAKSEVYLNPDKVRDIRAEEGDLKSELSALEAEYQGRT
jgi:hypothetical protein